MKKLLCVILSLVMIVSSCSLVASAAGEVTAEPSEYPVVIVPGYSSTNLYYGDSLETGEPVWGLDWDHVLSRVFARIAELGIGLGKGANLHRAHKVSYPGAVVILWALSSMPAAGPAAAGGSSAQAGCRVQGRRR